jgi:hypothetical protein
MISWIVTTEQELPRGTSSSPPKSSRSPIPDGDVLSRTDRRPSTWRVFRSTPPTSRLGRSTPAVVASRLDGQNDWPRRRRDGGPRADSRPSLPQYFSARENVHTLHVVGDDSPYRWRPPADARTRLRERGIEQFHERLKQAANEEVLMDPSGLRIGHAIRGRARVRRVIGREKFTRPWI